MLSVCGFWLAGLFVGSLSPRRINFEALSVMLMWQLCFTCLCGRIQANSGYVVCQEEEVEKGSWRFKGL
jgi:hypothetical protein